MFALVLIFLVTTTSAEILKNLHLGMENEQLFLWKGNIFLFYLGFECHIPLSAARKDDIEG